MESIKEVLVGNEYSNLKENKKATLTIEDPFATCSAFSVGDLGLIPGSGASPEGNGNPIQYPCLENSMNRGAWQATVHAVGHN